MIQNKRNAFTIVELVVVITILGILSTIGFVSYSGYLSGARDSNRLSQLEGLTKGLNVTLTKGRLPYPDSKVNINSGSTDTIAYQGVAGETVLERIGYSNDGLDPKDKTNFLYYTTKNRKYFQLMAFLEDDQTEISMNGIDSSYAEVDYSVRYPSVSGNKLGILVTSLNEPLAEYLLDAGLTEIDITNINDLELKSYLKDNQFVEGTGSTFSPLVNVDKVGGKYYSIVNNSYIYNPPVY